MLKKLDKLEEFLIKLTQSEKIELKEEFPLKEDTSILISFDPKLEIGAVAMVAGVNAPEGDAILEDGRVISISSDSIVTAITDAIAEANIEEIEPTGLSDAYDAKSEIEKLSNEISELKSMIKLSLENSINLSKEIEVVKALPVSAPIEKPNYLKQNLQLFNL